MNDAVLVFAYDGALRTRALPGATRAARMVVTRQSELVLNTNAAPLIEATVAGETSARRSFNQAEETWYHGGFCSGPQGEIGLTGRIGPKTHFDFLDANVVLTPGRTFVLHSDSR